PASPPTPGAPSPPSTPSRPAGPGGPGSPCNPCSPCTPCSPCGPCGPVTTVAAGVAGFDGASSPVACATAAIVSPPETAKSTTAHAKPIRIDRGQRDRCRWVRHVGPRVGCLLVHRERPPPEGSEVLA